MTRAIGYAVAGVAVGVATKWADDVANQVAGVAGEILGRIGSAPALWMLVVVIIAVVNRQTATQAPVRGAAFFLGVSAGYYVYSEVVLGFAGTMFVAFWLIAAITIAPASVALAVWAHRTANDESLAIRSRFVACLAIGAFISVPLTELAAYLSLAVGESAHEPLSNLASAGLQVMIGCAIWLLMARTPSARLGSAIGALLVTPLTWLGYQVLFQLPYLVSPTDSG